MNAHLERCRPFFPLVEMAIGTDRVPATMLGVGPGGEQVVRRARELPANPAVHPRLLGEVSSPSATFPPPQNQGLDTPWRALDRRHKEVFLVGRCEDIKQAWPQVVAGLRVMCRGGEPLLGLLALDGPADCLAGLKVPP